MQSRQTVLVVDGNGSDRLLPGLILRPFGFKVLECVSGEEAMELLPLMSLDVVLLDLFMPGLSGLDVLRQIRQNPLHQLTRVIAYTDQANKEDEAELILRGFSAVLLKPIKSAALLKLIIN